MQPSGPNPSSGSSPSSAGGGPARSPSASPGPAASAERLRPELEAALLRELVRTWTDLNWAFFKGVLRKPVLRLTENVTLLGRWNALHRSVEISLPLLVRASWGHVVEVLKHEMAHQYVDEVLQQAQETAHGPAFRSVCEKMGARPDASGPIAASSEQADPQRAKMLKRVADLLALANSSNLHEAEAAAAAAQRLMLKYNIELSAEPSAGRYDFMHLGVPSGRVPEHDHILASILADHFFVEAIWVPAFRPLDGKRGSVLEISGSPENLQIASYVHAFLQGTAERLWREHRRSQWLRSNRDRRTFLSGVMEGFRERLKQDKARCREQGLVWVGDPELKGFHRTRHPHIRHVRLVGHSRNEARAHGRAAGRKIVLHQGVGAGGHGASGPPRLAAPKSLPPARGAQ